MLVMKPLHLLASAKDGIGCLGGSETVGVVIVCVGPTVVL